MAAILSTGGGTHSTIVLEDDPCCNISQDGPLKSPGENSRPSYKNPVMSLFHYLPFQKQSLFQSAEKLLIGDRVFDGTQIILRAGTDNEL